MKNSYSKIAAIVIVSLFLSCARKNTPAGSKGNMLIKIMSYNVHHCNPPSKSGVIDVDAVAAAIKKENADIVALQEIDVNTLRSGKINEAAQIALKAGYPSFFFGKAIDYDGGTYGIAILSKYKLSNTRVQALPTDTSTNGEHRAIAIGEITLPNDKTFYFASTHLDAGRNEVNRLLQIQEINRITDQIDSPFIIAGDFNASEESKVINILDEKFTRTCKNCKSENGRERVIDYIAYKPEKDFSVLSHRVVPEHYASDHFPIVATIQLKF